MTIEINPKAVVAMIAFATATVTTANGAIDNYITFAGEANAAAFCLVSAMMTIFSAAAAFKNVNF